MTVLPALGAPVRTRRMGDEFLGDTAMLLWHDGSGHRGCLKSREPEGENGMQTLRIAVIGCGKRWKTPGATGFGMAHLHMAGYRQAVDVKLAGAADLKLENAKEFVAEYEP